MLGLAFLLCTAGNDGDPTTNLKGDVVALVGTFFIVMYYFITQVNLGVQNIPPFAYNSGVYGVAFLCSYIMSIIWDIENAVKLFRWCDIDVIAYVLWIAVVPGFFG